MRKRVKREITPEKASAVAIIVEDEPIVLDLAQEILIDMGFRIIGVPDAKGAMEALLGIAEPDLLITDVHMPGDMDGLALAREAAQRWPKMRIVIVSGRGGFPLDQLPPNAVFLAKPYLSEDLEHAILG